MAYESLVRLGAVQAAERAQRIASASEATLRRGPAPVTPREQDVLRLLAEGLTNRQIAERSS